MELPKIQTSAHFPSTDSCNNAVISCDRREILDRFDRRLEEKKQNGINAQFFLLVWQKYSEAESLVRRLITHLKEEMPSNKVKYSGFAQITIESIDFYDGDSVEDCQFKLKRAFNRGIQPQALSLLQFVQNLPPSYVHYEYLPFALKIRMGVHSWDKVGRCTMEWFIHDFSYLPETSPCKVIFFLILELEEKITKEPSNLITTFFIRKKQAQTIAPQELIRLFAEEGAICSCCTALPPLRLVDRKDLADWYSQFNSNEREREMQVDDLINRLPKKGKWNMSDVEVELKKIVEHQQNIINGI